MTIPATSTKSFDESADSVPVRPITLRDVLADCGGPLAVAKKLRVAPTTIYTWSRAGRVPDSDLKTSENGGTTYSDQLADMQKAGSLTGGAIRRLGRRL